MVRVMPSLPFFAFSYSDVFLLELPGVLSRGAAKIGRGSFVMDHCSERLGSCTFRLHWFSFRVQGIHGWWRCWFLLESGAGQLWTPVIWSFMAPWKLHKRQNVLHLWTEGSWRVEMVSFPLWPSAQVGNKVSTLDPGGKRKVVWIWEGAPGCFLLMQIGMVSMAIAGGSAVLHWRTNEQTRNWE